MIARIHMRFYLYKNEEMRLTCGFYKAVTENKIIFHLQTRIQYFRLSKKYFVSSSTLRFLFIQTIKIRPKAALQAC